MSKGVGEYLIAFAYLSVLTGSICGSSFKVAAAVDCSHVVQLVRATRLGSTHSVYGLWALVVCSKSIEEENHFCLDVHNAVAPSLSSLFIFIFFLSFLFFLSLFLSFLFSFFISYIFFSLFLAT